VDLPEVTIPDIHFLDRRTDDRRHPLSGSAKALAMATVAANAMARNRSRLVTSVV
jgi:hypothetical protein